MHYINYNHAEKYSNYEVLWIELLTVKKVKMAKKNEENFLSSGIFTFDSPECTCEKSRVTVNISEGPIPAIKLSLKDSRKIHFAFGSKVGLVRVKDDGSVEENNLLGKLVGIKQGDIQGYIQFFQNNGFIIPLSPSQIENYSFVVIQSIVDRLRATLELMSTITDMTRTSYEKIVRLIFYHLFAPVVSLSSSDEKYHYVSCKHQYGAFLDANKNAPREERLKDTFNNVEFHFNDSFGTFSLNADFVDSALSGGETEEKYQTQLFKNVFTVYCSSRTDKPEMMVFVNDFIFHYLYEVGMINYVDVDRTYYVNDEVHKELFTEELKAAAIKVAKFIVKEEIEYNLNNVRPIYDISKLEPAWKIDSLLSALYFGLFYMRPNTETYRRCANPKCGEFFSVPISSRKKKYCCRACMNRAMIARKRARDKINATRNQ